MRRRLSTQYTKKSTSVANYEIQLNTNDNSSSCTTLRLIIIIINREATAHSKIIYQN